MQGVDFFGAQLWGCCYFWCYFWLSCRSWGCRSLFRRWQLLLQFFHFRACFFDAFGDGINGVQTLLFGSGQTFFHLGQLVLLGQQFLLQRFDFLGAQLWGFCYFWLSSRSWGGRSRRQLLLQLFHLAALLFNALGDGINGIQPLLFGSGQTLFHFCQLVLLSQQFLLQGVDFFSTQLRLSICAAVAGRLC